MINNIPKPNISSDFTIDDIHKIREWHYECLKDASFDEYLKDIENQSNNFLRRMRSFND
ncbi:MAG: hypothetical protein FWF51_11960 [Chitinivibrionia bacterium]|nr:hypothetical protein [Chitinivibrionia bacterium]